MQRTDEQLVAAYAGHGDDRAFEILVARHQERVYSFLHGMVNDADVADDLFQDTFLRVIHALRKTRGAYRDEGRFGAWVMRIARNAALDYLRRRRRWHEDGTGATDGPDPWELLADDAPDALTRVENDEQSRWIESCIERLPPEQREVLLLRHDGELTFREIAEITDCSINTALGRMRYALNNLRRMMAEPMRDGLVRAG